MAPTAPSWPNPGLGLNLEITDAMMMNLGGAGAATGQPAMQGGGGAPQRPMAFRAAAAADPTPPAFPDFGQRFPEMINNQAVRGDHQMGGAGMAGLTLLGQVAQLSPNAARTGQIGGVAAAAGLGGATGGAALAGQTGMYSNVGGAVNQAIAGAGDGLRMPGAGPGAAALAAAGLPPPPLTHLIPNAPPRGPPAPQMGGAPSGPVVPVRQPQRAVAAGAPPPGQGAVVPVRQPQQAAAVGAPPPRPRRRTARLRGEHGCGERCSPRGPVRHDYLQPVRTAGPAAHPSTGPTAATAATAGASGRPSCGFSRQRSGTAGCGAATAGACRPSGWRPAGLSSPARPASSVPRRSAGTDGFAGTTAIHSHVWPSPPPWFSR